MAIKRIVERIQLWIFIKRIGYEIRRELERAERVAR